MRTVIAMGSVAVTTEYWEGSQPDGTIETGCRLELRRVRDLTPPTPPPYPRRDAVYWSIEDHLWRADLFTEVGGPPRGAAHYHPTFEGLVPCDRVLDPAIVRDPEAWAIGRLSDIPGMLREAGHADIEDELDRAVVDQAMPAVLAALRATLAYRDPSRAA